MTVETKKPVESVASFWLWECFACDQSGKVGPTTKELAADLVAEAHRGKKGKTPGCGGRPAITKEPRLI